MDQHSRRRLLRACGAAGVAGLSATAGCLGFLGGDGDSQETTTEGGGETTTESEETTTGSDREREPYLLWLPDPNAADMGAEPGYTHLYYDVLAFREHRDALHKTTYNEAVRSANSIQDAVGANPRDVDGYLQIGTRGTQVVTGQFDTDALTNALEERKFAQREPYRGHDLYVQLQEDNRAVAFDETKLVVSRRWGPSEPLEVVRWILDTYRGETERYYAADDDFRAATDPVRDAHRAGGQVMEPPEEPDPAAGQFAGNTAFGYGFTLGESTSEATLVYVFDDEGQADPGAVRTWADEGVDGLDQYDEYEVTKEGRTVRLTGTVATERLDFLSDGDPGDSMD